MPDPYFYQVAGPFSLAELAELPDVENGAWSYETPNEAVAKIKDHLAFYPDNGVTVERI